MQRIEKLESIEKVGALDLRFNFPLLNSACIGAGFHYAFHHSGLYSSLKK